ncbi:hypothetical protein Tco_1449845 [Tanacetum coccineum]
MEVLTLILKRRVHDSDFFRYHKHSEELNIINVCFADDLFIFARGDVESAKVIKDSLDEFKSVSRLVLSIPKSTAYFCNVLNHVKIGILSIMPFSKGVLPVKYLGVLLISSRLLNKDWILLNIQQLMRTFLWCNGEYKRGRAKMAWDDICLPKHEGGLGLRSLETFNIALMTTHLWNIVSNKESLWVQWIHAYKLKGRSIWDIPLEDEMSWGWGKILQLQEIVRPYFWVKLGNGKNTSLWFDSWCSLCPLSQFLTVRDITREGFSLYNTVAD